VTCRICSGFHVPKITKICLFLTELNITRRHHYAWAKMRPTVTVEAWSVYMCVLATIVSPEKKRLRGLRCHVGFGVVDAQGTM